jgi:hypothetical protein
MFVNAGYIIGFDTERGSVARGIIDCIEKTSIPVNMVGLLYALPTTQLTRRLAASGRLPEGFDVAPENEGDQCTTGINFVPCRPKIDILRDYLEVVETVYSEASYFARVRRVGEVLESGKRRFAPGLAQWLRELKGFGRMIWKLGIRSRARGEFWRTLLHVAWKNPRSVRYATSLMALYLHFGPFSREVARRIRIAIEREERRPSEVAPAPAPRAVPAKPVAAVTV